MVLDWIRRRLGHQLRMGQTLHDAVVRNLPPTIDTEIVRGIRVRIDLRQEVARSTWWSGRHYEDPTPKVLAGWLGGGVSRFFDIGANSGWFSYMALTFPGVEVDAFEPRADLYKQLLAAKDFNNLDRFHPHHLGISDAKGTLRLRVADHEAAYSTFGPHPALLAESEPVDVVEFDSWRASARIELPDSPRWLAKIDVEGFEAKVLRGMAASLNAQAFVGIAVELNSYTLDFCGSSVEEVIHLLRQAGYRRLLGGGEDRMLNGFFVPA